MSTWRWINPNSASAGTGGALLRTRKNTFVSEASIYRLLKAHDLITSPAYIVIKAAEEFKDKTTGFTNQLWQTDFTYLKITGWGWYYLSTVLDDFSRFIVAWKLCAIMKAQDVTATLSISGVGGVWARSDERGSPATALVGHNGSSYVASDLAGLADKQEDRACPRSALPSADPRGKIERWHQTAQEPNPA